MNKNFHLGHLIILQIIVIFKRGEMQILMFKIYKNLI